MRELFTLLKWRVLDGHTSRSEKYIVPVVSAVNLKECYKMTESQPVELRIPVPWGYIAGCWYGDQLRRPLLALHGWQDNAGSFARLAPLIAAHRSILAIDLPGHGRSSHFPAGMSYHFNDFVRIVHRVVRHYKWPKVSFMGHSMGAALSFYYAALFPNSVDMIIAIDALTTLYFPPHIQIDMMSVMTEKALNEEDRLRAPAPVPIFDYESLTDLLYRGSEQSVELAHCKCLLERSVRRADGHSDMYYFSRDGRVKLMEMLFTQPELVLALAERLRNIHYLVIKAELSYHIELESLKDVFSVLRANNPTFEFHVMKGEKHHVHLNSPDKVAACVLPYLQMYGGGGCKLAEAKL
ncbi:probable serine hydrolase [Zeugodacus cucurbitae]|uniref:probable serine hydrolase n=1 Tax=Zeugodacus cucurbitae TaxID=28588 RepID=UPI0023D8EB2B|nr:probable serine hydrolase [Zeugodacus cucurbitae]